MSPYYIKDSQQAFYQEIEIDAIPITHLNLQDTKIDIVPQISKKKYSIIRDAEIPQGANIPVSKPIVSNTLMDPETEAIMQVDLSQNQKPKKKKKKKDSKKESL